MEAKYLSDGRKVVVIGQLNNVESIVQEVFISESGDQIPSGEKFTTKNLHDEPVKSWKEKETEKNESRYNKVKTEIKDIEKEMRLMKSKRQGHSDIVRANLKLIDAMPDIDWSFFCDVMTGNIKWVTGYGYQWDNPKSFDDSIYCWDSYSYEEGGSYEGIKIITALGVRGGKMKFHVSTYSDGSGNGSNDWRFFKTDGDLNDYLINRMNKEFSKGNLSTSNINNLSKYIDIDQSIIDEVLKKERAYAQKRYDDAVESAGKDLGKYNKKIDGMIKLENKA